MIIYYDEYVFVVALELSVYFLFMFEYKIKVGNTWDFLEYQFTMQIVFTDNNDIWTYLKMSVDRFQNIHSKVYSKHTDLKKK